MIRSVVAIVSAFSIVLSAAAPPILVDGGWPRSYTTQAGATVVIYQPQVASWANQAHVVLYSAIAYTPAGATAPAFGTVTVESDTSVAIDQRLVSFSEFHVTTTSFPTLAREQLVDLVQEITSAVPLQQRVIALDRVLANVDKSQIMPRNVDGVKADPPATFVSTTPAVLVNLDGAAIWSPIPSNDLQFAVNTNWPLFKHTPTGTLYLLSVDTWLKAPDVNGPWSYAPVLPDSFFKLPDDANWKDVKGALPGKRIAANQAPKVFVSTVPAELILMRGAPSYVLVDGTQNLLWVSNTDADVFRMGRTGTVYYLIAGRWFSAPDFTGPWTFATPNLPDAFKQIPLEHPRSRVLASVPGTPQAAEAVLIAQIPQTARVGKDTKAPDVVYQGAPQFEPIPQTTVARAVNTDKDIIRVGDLYYMCFQGVWFVSTTANGPWQVTGSVPQQIYEIPVSSPAHTVTYVTVQQSNSDAVVFATAMAYTGVMVAWGCAVWGTGYYYPPYVVAGVHPIYYPHYQTYGYAAAYNPWTGAYAHGAAAYGPYGGAAAGARYNPTTGTYARGAMAYGPYGAQGAAQAYNARTGTYAQTRQGSNVYGSWGQTSVQRGDDWAQTSRYTSNVTGNTTRTATTSGGDVYAGHDGNVYKKSSDGGWQKYDNGGWNNVQQPTAPQREQFQSQASQLNSDAAARAEGAQRTSDLSGVQSGQGRSSSYRPSGSGSRSAGGRRR